MSLRNVSIRLARPGESQALTELCLRSKAYWGYDAAFMAASAGMLAIGEAVIRANFVLMAVSDFGAPQDAPLGVAAVMPMDRNEAFELSHLFVAPEAFGRGIGRALFDAAARLAASRGAKRLSILSDPNAMGFYEKLGARYLGEAPSDAIPGRSLPLFEYPIRASES